MKKITAALLAIAALFSLAACSAQTSAAPVTAAPTGSQPAAPSAEANAAAQAANGSYDDVWYELSQEGHVLTVRLPSNPTTGYDWSFEISNSDIIEFLTNEYVQDKAGEGMTGAGGTWVSSFANMGKAYGDVTISFKYARSWEHGEPQETRTIDLFVDESGEISVK